MFGVMVSNVQHLFADGFAWRHDLDNFVSVSMENMRRLPSLRALERRASMLIRIKKMIWQRSINSEQGVSYWACAMASTGLEIRFSDFGYWKAPSLPLEPPRTGFSNELGPTFFEALDLLGGPQGARRI